MKRTLLALVALLALALPTQAQTPTIRAFLTTTVCPGAGCTVLSVSGMGSASVQVTGTFSGTLQLESSLDGVTYTSLSMTPSAGGDAVTSATAPGVWSSFIGGLGQVRVRFSSYTSGAATVTIAGAPGLAAPGLTGVIVGNGVQSATAIPFPADATKYLNGVGAFAVPAAGNPFNQSLNTSDSPHFAGLTVAGLTYPTSDGTDGQCLQTDGMGTLSWGSCGGGGSSPLVLTSDGMTEALVFAMPGGATPPDTTGTFADFFNPPLVTYRPNDSGAGGSGPLNFWVNQDSNGGYGRVSNTFLYGGSLASKTAFPQSDYIAYDAFYLWNGTDWDGQTWFHSGSQAPVVNGIVPSYFQWNFSGEATGASMAAALWAPGSTEKPGLYFSIAGAEPYGGFVEEAPGVLGLRASDGTLLLFSATGTVGDWVVGALADPAAPSIANVGTPGSTTYTYKVVALTVDGHSVASAGGTTTTGNATLDETNANTVTWAAVTGAATYDIYRTAGGATQGLIATGLKVLTLSDTGLAGDSASAPATNTTGRVQATGYKSSDGSLGATVTTCTGFKNGLCVSGT